MSLVPVREYTSAEEMRAAYIARRQRFRQMDERAVAIARAPAPEPAAPVEEEPAAAQHAEVIRDWIISEAPKAALRPSNGRVVMRIVSDVTGVSVIDIVSHRRTTSVIPARMICAYALRHYTTMSFPQIGSLMGGRDHTTILHSVRIIEDRLSSDADLSAKLLIIRDLIEASHDS